MAEPEFTPEAREALDRFLSFWPLVSRGHHREKLLRAVEYRMLTRNAAQADTELLVCAVEDAFPSFETFALALKDPARINAVMASQQTRNPDDPIGRVTRWESPPVAIDRPVRDVFALLAGPRAGGNTDCILDAVLEGMRESGASIEKACFSKLQIAPCNGCLACQGEKSESRCIIQDDMTPIYDRLRECDAFVLGFPVYSAREASQTAVFFDRLKALSNPWKPMRPEPKKGALVATWGWPSPRLYREVVYNIAFLVRHFGVETAEIVTGCGFWGAYYEKGSACLDTAGMEQAREAGRAICRGQG